MRNDESRAEVFPEPEAPRVRPPLPPLPAAAGPEPASVAPPLLAQLEHALKLDTSQISYLVRILREREAEIRDCHERYRRMGVLDIRDYEWWVADRKSLWFRRVDAVLDPAQHALWTALQGQNPLGQGLEFEVSEGMAILE